MKYVPALLLIFLNFFYSYGQGGLPDYFLDGKSVVLVSASPQARPSMEWQEISELLHAGLLSIGGDPVGYYELEDIALSPEVQAGYASAFSKRLIRSIVLLTRKSNGQVALHIAPFTGNTSMVPSSGIWAMESDNLEDLGNSLHTMGQQVKSKNFLVLEIPEFPNSEAGIESSRRFLARNPLNLDAFKLGIPLSGAAGDAGLLMSFRYDLLGKSDQAVKTEQEAEKSGLEQLFKELYPYGIEFLTNPRGDAELVRDRIQFVLMRLEGKEGDLMESMGLPVDNPEEKTRIVVKYYIRLIVRDELYIGPEWDADPDWRKALSGFLNNLQKK
ncbi:NTPase [Cecembia sp.]|uniref:NTPase n=1 Tax=Cecembia sp. TaxID=1898110 RepID=UPI0025C048F1|nr:NTPase [Cecembia sp.]